MNRQGLMLSARCVLVFLLSSLLNPRPGSCGLGAWTSIGPEGGTFDDIVVDPSHPQTLYASVLSAGVLKSTDGGEKWTLSFSTTPVWELILDPLQPSRIYAATPNGVIRSIDGGDNWAPANQGFTNPDVRELAIDPTQSDVLYAATWDPTAEGGSVFKSTDGGDHWNEILRALVQDIAIDPLHPDTVYLSTHGQGILKSIDGGSHWSDSSNGLPSSVTYEITIDPSTPGHLFLTVPERLYESSDAAATWKAVPLGFSVRCGGPRLTVDPVHPAMLYLPCLDIRRSTDGGRTWTILDTKPSPAAVWHLVVDPSDPGTLYAPSSAGAFKSTDGGATWRWINQGSPYAQIFNLAISPVEPRFLYANGATGGIYSSADAGGHWQWRGAQDGLGQWTGLLMVIDPLHPSVVYSSGGNLYRSTDAGTTWKTLLHMERFGFVTALAVDPRRTSILYIGTSGNGIFKSIDNGSNWIHLPPGSAPGGDEPIIRRLLIDPQDPQTIYALTGKGLRKSEDGGFSWNTLLLNPDLSCFALDPLQPSTLYAAGLGARILKSRDGGLTWRTIDIKFIPENRGFVDLVVDPTRPGVLYATVDFYGVLQSVDKGESWSGLGDLPTRVVKGLAMSAGDPSTLYVATEGRGILTFTPLNVPPSGPYLHSADFPGFRFKVRFTAAGKRHNGMAVACARETLCVSEGRHSPPTVLIRITRARWNGYRWVQIARLTPSQVEVWIEQDGTGIKHYYRLDTAEWGSTLLQDVIDRTAFVP